MSLTLGYPQITKNCALFILISFDWKVHKIWSYIEDAFQRKTLLVSGTDDFGGYSRLAIDDPDGLSNSLYVFQMYCAFLCIVLLGNKNNIPLCLHKYFCLYLYLSCGQRCKGFIDSERRVLTTKPSCAEPSCHITNAFLT